MTAFPNMSSVPYGNPVGEEIHFKTSKNRFDALGAPKRRQQWLFPKRVITLRNPYLTKAQAAVLFQFYIARAGAYESFNFFYEQTAQGTLQSYAGEYVGTGDDTTTGFNAPSKSGTSVAVYLNTVLQTGGGTHYTFTGGGGADGADLITFVVAPPTGQHVTYDFAGYLKIHCTFKDDKLTLEQFYDKLVRTGLKLQGELNA